jgi:hypothetical protein
MTAARWTGSLTASRSRPELTCRAARHEHTPWCHVYGSHDFRRAFATQNAKRMTGDALHELMRHKSDLTTKVYIEMTDQVSETVGKLHVPEFLQPQARKKDGAATTAANTTGEGNGWVIEWSGRFSQAARRRNCLRRLSEGAGTRTQDLRIKSRLLQTRQMAQNHGNFQHFSTSAPGCKAGRSQ